MDPQTDDSIDVSESGRTILKGAPCNRNHIFYQGFGCWLVTERQYNQIPLLKQSKMLFLCDEMHKALLQETDDSFIPATLQPDCTYKVHGRMTDQQLEAFKSQDLVFYDFINVYRKKKIGDQHWIFYAIY